MNRHTKRQGHASQYNIPQLRFPEFEGEWEEKKLGNISSKIGSGKTPKGGEEVYTSYGIPFIRSQNVIDNNLILDKTHIPENIHIEMKSSKVLSNDILLNITGGSIGRSCVVPNNFEEGNVNQHVCIIRLKNDSPKFLQSIISSHQGQKLIFQGQTGSGREGLNFESIKGFNINFPTLPEQQRIAGFLTAVDEKLTALKKKKELLEQYKKGVMQKLFSQQIRFKPDLSEVEGDENGNEFPEWEVKKLGNVAEKINHKNVADDINNVLTNSATDGIVSQRDYFEKDIANQNNLAGYYIVQKDDFVYNPRISNAAPVGPIKRNKLGVGVMSPLYSVLRFSKGNLDYFEFYFETSYWHSYMNSVANFGARFDRMNVTNSDFLKMPIPFPCLEEQTRIANFLSAIDKKINETAKQIEAMAQWKKGLLQQMFV